MRNEKHRRDFGRCPSAVQIANYRRGAKDPDGLRSRADGALGGPISDVHGAGRESKRGDQRSVAQHDKSTEDK